MLPVTLLSLALGLMSARAAAPAPPATSAAAEKTIVGEIVSLDVGQSRLVVQEASRTVRAKGEEPKNEIVTLQVDGATKVVIGRNPSVLTELKPKDHVVVRYVVTAKGPRATSLRVAERTPPTPATPAAASPAPATSPSTGAGS